MFWSDDSRALWGDGKPGDAPTTFDQCGVGSGIERGSGFIGLTTLRVRGQEALLYQYNNEVVVAC